MFLTITLSSLLVGVAIAALVLTLIIGFVFKEERRSWFMTYVQNFCGALFLFSGWVKAVDPLGTAYKLQDYFNEFQHTFEPTWLSFLNPLFESMAGIAVWVSVSVIIFERHFSF